MLASKSSKQKRLIRKSLTQVPCVFTDEVLQACYVLLNIYAPLDIYMADK